LAKLLVGDIVSHPRDEPHKPQGDPVGAMIVIIAKMVAEQPAWL